MNVPDYFPVPPPLAPAPLPSGPRSFLPGTVLAWAFILLIAIGLPVLNQISHRFEPAIETAKAGFGEYQGQYSLGFLRSMPNQDKKILDQIEEQLGGQDGKHAMRLIQRALQPNEIEPEAVIIEGDFLRHNAWYAQLASAKSSSEYQFALQKADKIFVLTFITGISALFILALGVVLGIGAIILFATGWLKMDSRRRQAPAGIYIEAFAIYLLLFLVSSVIASVALRGVSIGVMMIPMGFSVLVAVAWPLIRGVPRQMYRDDMGLHAGRGVLWEIGSGIVGYLACLPLLALSLLVVLALQHFAHQTTSHPIAGEVGTTSPIILLLLAAVFAPITEEIMFRGLLVAHLRAKLGILLSGIINGLIFASIHPQGWLAIPALMTIAISLTLLREWRGSLIAPITAHALNNGVVMMLVIYMAKA